LTYVSTIKAYLFIRGNFLGGSFPGDFDLLGRRRLNRRNRVCRGDMAISDFCVPAAEEDETISAAEEAVDPAAEEVVDPAAEEDGFWYSRRVISPASPIL
jgi:hypothetical protein